MNMDADNLPVFDEDTVYEITLKPNYPGGRPWTHGSVLVKNDNGATRGLHRLLCRYLFPVGTVQLVNGEVQPLPVAPTLRDELNLFRARLLTFAQEEGLCALYQSKIDEALVKRDQAEAIAEWAKDRDAFFTASSPAMDADLASIFDEGDERTTFVLLYRFLSSLTEFDLAIKESDIEVFDR